MLKGSFLVIRHHADGTISRIKSNALGGLAIQNTGGCGIATFTFKATYTTWVGPPILGAYVTTGGNAVKVYAEDRNEPGTGADFISIGGPGRLAMGGTAAAKTVIGGNIAIPHTPKRWWGHPINWTSEGGADTAPPSPCLPPQCTIPGPQYHLGMIPGRRRVLAMLLVPAVLAGGGAHALAARGVTRSEVASAESAVDLAEQNLAAARGELAQAVNSLDRLEATVVRLGERRQADLASAQTQQVALRSRVATLYMSAGARVASVVIGDVTSFSTRVAYLAAVSEQDRSALNRFTLSAVELDALLESAGRQREITQARIADLTAHEVVRASELEVVRARYSEVKRAWDAQEAARIAAEEAELRRQEAALAAQVATTTTTRPSGPTTTRPDYGYIPGAGVEQWRPMVTEVFADWGLDQTKCATRNGIEFCVSGQIDNALRIMRCESSGIPFAENPSSGAAGLFQNLPYYWPSRVARVRAYYSSMSNLPADASIWNPEHNTVVSAMLLFESREAILGNRGGAGVSPAVWPEFNWERYATSGYGYSAWGKGPNPWGHWSCGAQLGIYDSSWVHPWAIQQTAP